MKIGIYDPYLASLEGGERYMLTIASLLSHSHTVSVFWDDPKILRIGQERFDLNLSKVYVTKNIFSPHTHILSRLVTMRKYDRIFFLSDGSIPFSVKKNIIIHFQFPVEWVHINDIRSILCNSFYTKHYIDRKFHYKSAVLYPPVPVNLQSVIGNKKNIILTVGRIARDNNGSYFKKQDFMIKEFIKLVDKGLKGWELIVVVIVKDQDKLLFDSLQKLAKNYPIHIKANLSFSNLREIYSAARIYWHAAGYGEDTIKYPEKAEHFGMTTVEAMSYGVVPVVIKAGGQKEIVKDKINGFLWETTDELEEKTNMLIFSEQLRMKMSVEAQKRAKHFSTEVFRNTLEQIL